MSLNAPSSNDHTTTEKRKTRFFAHFALAHLDVMRLLKTLGLLRQTGEKSPTDEEQRDKKIKHHERFARRILNGEERSFRNIADHSLVVGVVADILLQEAVKKGLITDAQRKQGVYGALLHDATKRKELELQLGTTKQDKNIFFDPEALIRVRKLIFEILAVSAEMQTSIDLAKYSGDGLLCLSLDEIKERKSSEDLISFIICIADYLVKNTREKRSHLVVLDERLMGVLSREELTPLLKWWSKRLFDISEPELTIFAEKKRVLIMEKIVKSALGIPPSMQLFDFVQGKMNEAIDFLQ